MADQHPMIVAAGVSKSYTVGSKAATFREWLSFWNRPERKQESSFWALADVSFSIDSGEAVGIIGRNGSGKSTLLKILSRITHPTRGKISLYGRVGALLEVGTGFHPELTGRENVFLNGSILGMKQAEIRQKFDSIVDFAGIEQHIDTAVKHYSSGMYVRLAFAVAAFLDPEILVLDEVLAVGDAAFQKKCLAKLVEITQQGRTVLFVSHQMSLVSALCQRCILLNQGYIYTQGPVASVIQDYNYLNQAHHWTAIDLKAQPLGDTHARLYAAYCVDSQKKAIDYASREQQWGICIEWEMCQTDYRSYPSIYLKSVVGEIIFVSYPTPELNTTKIGRYQAYVWFPSHFLNAATYTIDVVLLAHIPRFCVHADVKNQIQITVTEDLTNRSYGVNLPVFGMLQPQLEWESYSE
jgi:lipopolysaccharide transport system ATP-binding protein